MSSTVIADALDGAADDPLADRVSALGAQAIANLGSEAAAADAVILAVDAGHDYDQLRAAILADMLAADGTIDGVLPADPPAALVVGFRRTAEPTPIEVLRQRAQELAEREDEVLYEIRSKAAVEVYLMLAALGYSAEEIVEAIVFGVTIDVDGEARSELEKSCRNLISGGFDLGVTVFSDCEEAAVICSRFLSINGEAPVRAPACDLSGKIQSAAESTTTSEANTDPLETEPLIESPGPVVLAEGELTGGPMLTGASEGSTIDAILANRFSFSLSLGEALVEGEGLVDREIDWSNEACRDRRTSPLGFDFIGAFDGDDQTSASGTFDWRVRGDLFNQLELVDLDEGDDFRCEGVTSYATGVGTWVATYDEAAGTVSGSLTIEGGLGTNTFELAVTSIVTD